MLQAQGQFMTDVEHWHTTLSVVGELGCTMFKQQLIHIVHDVPHAVLRARKCEAAASVRFTFPVAAHSFH
jgi:hypothetical protein